MKLTHLGSSRMSCRQCTGHWAHPDLCWGTGNQHPRAFYKGGLGSWSKKEQTEEMGEVKGGKIGPDALKFLGRPFCVCVCVCVWHWAMGKPSERAHLLPGGEARRGQLHHLPRQLCLDARHALVALLPVQGHSDQAPKARAGSQLPPPFLHPKEPLGFSALRDCRWGLRSGEPQAGAGPCTATLERNCRVQRFHKEAALRDTALCLELGCTISDQKDVSQIGQALVGATSHDKGVSNSPQTHLWFVPSLRLCRYTGS